MFRTTPLLTKMRPPLISVIGATGTGKSQLAIELALVLNGEVINADAMQLYRGLPLITNKATLSEQKGVPHHLLDFLPTRETWRVGRFIREAESTIADIRRRGKLPIVVGGTHYYVQSLLFPNSTPTLDEDGNSDEPPLAHTPVDDNLAEKYPILDASTEELYSELQRVDPVIATRWHPNDRRKIRRSLEIYYSSGGKHTASELYAAQRAAKAQPVADEAVGGSAHRNLVFWVHAETGALRARLDTRVDKMISGGMWDEIAEMEALWESIKAEDGDLSSGIWQSIGYKEFLPYLELRKKSLEEGGEAEREQELSERRKKGVELMKAATRQYAKTQVRWVRIKFLYALGQENKAAAAKEGEVVDKAEIFLLDSTDVSHYENNVVAPALAIARDFLAYSPLPDPHALSPLAKDNLVPKREFDMGQRPDLWVRKRCEVCNVIATNEPEWEYHVKSNRHKKKVASNKKKLEVEEFLRKRREAKELEERERTEKAIVENGAVGETVLV